jgi:TonB family protein
VPRDMFGDVANPSVRVGSQAWYTVPVSILAHVVLFGAVIIIPLMAADVLPTPPTMMAFVGAPPPPPPPPPPPSAPVRVGGNIKPPSKRRDVRPVYPPIAQSARVQGVVIIEATIGADGKVKDAKVLRSIPLLDQAAVDAVKQWEFTPTLLNGVPVPVIMTVTVQFTLQ